MAPETAVPFSFSSSGATSEPITFQLATPPQPSPEEMSKMGQSTGRQPLTFRNSKIIYYGPHACENCGSTICRMGREWGGNSFDYPGGPIYPNTEWHAHICDPTNVQRHSDAKGIPR